MKKDIFKLKKIRGHRRFKATQRKLKNKKEIIIKS